MNERRNPEVSVNIKSSIAFIRDDILGNPKLSDDRLKKVNLIFAELLRTSSPEQRAELIDFLERWKIRTLVVDAAAESDDFDHDSSGLPSFSR